MDIYIYNFNSKTDANGNAMLQILFPNLKKKRWSEDTLVTPSWEKLGKVNFFFFVHAAARGGTCAFTLKIVKMLIKNSSRDDSPLISTYNQPTANPLRVGQGQ